MAVRLTHELGDLIGGRWEVREVLGRGTYGTVYRCVDVTNHRVAAIKEMHVFADPAETASALAYFQHEGELLAELDHPRLPTAEPLTVAGPFTIDPQTGRVASADLPGAIIIPSRRYLVLDHVDGPSLETTVQRAYDSGSPLTARTVLHWVRQIAQALAYLHSRGLVHRDVKPANIVLSGNGETAMLVDLGLCREVHTVPGYGTVPIRESGRFGTPGYAPPDPVEQDDPTAASDLHALGMTARRALTGLDPTDVKQLAVLRSRPMLDLRSELEPFQAVALDRAIRTDARDRQPSMAAFVDSLDRPPAPAASLPRATWLELRPSELALGTVHPGQVRDLTVVIHDRRPGFQPEGEAISEDPRLRILPPSTRGSDVLLHLVLKVPAKSGVGPFVTSLVVRTAEEEHEVPVSYVVEPRRAGNSRGGCLTLGLGG